MSRGDDSQQSGSTGCGVNVVNAACREGIRMNPCDASVVRGSFRVKVAAAVFLLCCFFVKGIVDTTGSKTRREGGGLIARRN